MVNGRLKTLRALPLEEKVVLAYRILGRMFEVTDAVAVAFSGGRDKLWLCISPSRDGVMLRSFSSIHPSSSRDTEIRSRIGADLGFEFYEVRAEKNFWGIIARARFADRGPWRSVFLSRAIGGFRGQVVECML